MTILEGVSCDDHAAALGPSRAVGVAFTWKYLSGHIRARRSGGLPAVAKGQGTGHHWNKYSTLIWSQDLLAKSSKERNHLPAEPLIRRSFISLESKFPQSPQTRFYRRKHKKYPPFLKTFSCIYLIVVRKCSSLTLHLWCSSMVTQVYLSQIRVIPLLGTEMTVYSPLVNV